MRKTSLLIPLILVACLAILLYLVVMGFSSSEGDDLVAGRSTERVIQGRPEYAEEDLPDDLGRNTDPALRTRTPAERDRDVDDYFETVPDDEIVRPATIARQDRGGVRGDDEQSYQDRISREERQAASAMRSTPTSAPATAPRTTPSGGQYLVLAGSFRQYENATTRVENLRAAGFDDSRVERFDRGSFAVALAGQADSYTAANQMAERLRTAGFEAQVMRRR